MWPAVFHLTSRSLDGARRFSMITVAFGVETSDSSVLAPRTGEFVMTISRSINCSFFYKALLIYMIFSPAWAVMRRR